MNQSATTQFDFTVVTNERAAEGVWRMTLASDVARVIQPGQFVNISVPGDGAHILRIPLSFKWADAAKGTVELLYATVGEGTRRLASMRPQDTSTLVGPCGRGWWLPEAKGRCLLVSGGIGLPPVLAAARMLANVRVGFDVAVGARTQTMLIRPDVDEVMAWGAEQEGALGQAPAWDPERVVAITTDDGSVSAGTVGHYHFATDAAAQLLAERSYAQVYTCGPAVMMGIVARLAAEHGVACQTSLERMMGCGFGACSCCNVELVSGGYALCCQDGPVFDATEVVW